MLRGIDHLVIVVRDLTVAINNYRDLGFCVTPGGRHPIGSENALIPFEDGSYIELIGFTVPDSGVFWQDCLQNGGGIVDFCARCDSLKADTELLRRAGAKLAEPMQLSRERPDGYVLRWMLAMPQPPWAGIIPFLIEDITPREERVPSTSQHPNGVIGIDSIQLAIREPERLRSLYESVLGGRCKPIDVPQLRAAGLSIRIGTQKCQLLSSLNSTDPMAEWLKTRGPSPYGASLRTSSGRAATLDLNKTGNARLFLL